jgi:trimeric autotransporter adhesin
MRIRTALVLAVWMTAAAAATAAAQGFQGGLRGAAKDSGGVVPGVEVTITNQSTNIKRSVVTNDAGEYAFAAVEPGTYTLRAALQGFKTVERRDIRIGTQTFLVLDLTLEVGALAEEVTVTAQSPIIDTANASTGGTLDSKTLETLPAPGRNAFMIGVAVPTVVPSGDPQFNRQQDQTNASLLSLGGGARRGNNYLIDGVPITDLRNRESANPTIEAIEEVKVQVHTYDAEMGRTGGGVFNVTAKSGANQFHGSGFYQTRPNSLLKNNYFSDLAGDPKPDAYYYLWGGGTGGPIVKNRTFFWFAAEGYKSNTTRGANVTFPTAAMRRGDFSGLVNSSGQRIIIYDPLTTHTDPVTGQLVRDPFPGNIIPDKRINDVSRNILGFLPLPDSDLDNGNPNYTRTSQIIDRAMEYTGKVEHKFTDNVSLTGFYLYNKTDEPCADYFEPGLNGKNRFADPGDYLLKRRPQILALNNTWVLSNASVASFRFGWTRFPDNQTLTADFDPSTLGFNQNYLNLITAKKFPSGDIEGYDQEQGSTFGAITPNTLNYYSTSANGSYSRFVGTHTFKLGADYRKVGADFFSPGQGSGLFNFDRFFTSADPRSDGTATSGSSFASFLLGYPTGDPGNLSTLPLSTPLNVFTHYYGGYVQDDWRVNSNFTLNYGLRIEHEEGLQEAQNRFTVAFDQAAVSPLNTTIPADPVAGTPARQVLGGLRYAGKDGFPTQQGHLPKAKWSPRLGAVYSLNPRTVLRGGYGIYWAPWNFQQPDSNTNNYGQTGYTLNSQTPQGQFIPTVTLDNPFPNGVSQPQGNNQGLLTGVGNSVAFIDQNKGAPRVQQYSVDLQRELGGSSSVTLSYVGARGDNLGFGGTADATININQLDPKFMALGSKLNDQLPNPFFGNASAGPLSTQPTLSRAQLLRPFPEFGNVLASQSTGARSRYNAAIIEFQKRMTHGWGGRFSYTYSRLMDNQFGETNAYSRNPNNRAINNYDLDAEYSRGLLDVPHRLVLSPIVELPFGQGKRFANSGGLSDALLGGWTIAGILNFESGFPIAIAQNGDNTGTFSNAQRPNVVPGVDPNTSGNREDRFNLWIDPAAYSAAAPFTFGNAPRTSPDLRTPDRNNMDISVSKDVKLGGRLRGQLRLEELNINDHVKVNGPEQRVGRSNFGNISVQLGFMRITQLTFRMTF